MCIKIGYHEITAKQRRQKKFKTPTFVFKFITAQTKKNCFFRHNNKNATVSFVTWGHVWKLNNIYCFVMSCYSYLTTDTLFFTSFWSLYCKQRDSISKHFKTPQRQTNITTFQLPSKIHVIKPLITCTAVTLLTVLKCTT